MSNLSILIVEDEAIVAADLAAKVRQLGYDVVGPTATGEEAVELARQQRPSLVLMDIRLAGAMDGITAAEQIHRECRLPVLFLTAHSDAGTVERARQAEAFGYILKPFDEHDLRIQIEMALYKHAAEQKLRETAAELQIANTKLLDSRRAALNMMVDAVAARRRADEVSAELRESEKRYHTLFANMMEGFAYCKMLYDDQGAPMDFVYLDVNDSFARLTGLENVKGKKVTEVIPGIRESSQELFEIYNRVALTGESEKFEIEFKPLSVWFSISVYSMEREHFVAVFDDITERKLAERAMAESEERVRLKLESILSPEGDITILELADIIDVQAFQSLMDDFYKLAPMPMAILDLKGKVLVGKGWQEICTRFHRVHPETHANCIESDLQLTAGIQPGEFKLYKCKNNMWDVAIPIMVGDTHVGNLFSGQFFFDDEPLDYELFKSQAKRYDFNEDEYIAALNCVPRLSREFLATGMEYFTKFAGIISKLNYSNIKLARSLVERDALMEALHESNERLQLFIEHAPAALAMFDTDMRYLSVSRRWLSDYGLDERDLRGLSHYEVFPDISGQWKEAHRRGLAGEVLRAEADRFERPDGSVQWVRWEIRPWYDSEGNVGGIVIFSEDITLLKRAENVTHARLRMSMAEANMSIDETLQMALDDIEALTDSVIGFCHFLEADQETLSLQTWSSNTLGSMCTAEGKGSHYPVSQAGVWVDCVHERGPVIHNDYAALPHCKGMPPGHARIVREMLIPIIRKDLIVAIIGVGNKPTEYNSTDIEIASLLGDFAWEIVERKRAEEALRRAHDELEDRVAERTVKLAETVETLLEQISERERAEGSLQRLNRIYAVLCETNQAIVRVGDRDTLFHDFCRIAVEQGGFLLSWVGVLDKESNTVRSVAACGATGYLDDIRVSADEKPAGTGPTGISIREGTYYICNDFQNDSCTQPWHERGRTHGIMASASVAVKEEGKVIGALTLYAGEKDFFDRQHVELLVQMGVDISFALDNMAREARRQKAEQALQEETLERLRVVEALREKEQMLLQQNRLAAMGEMINNIAHQWRQPLNVLSLLIQQIQLFYDSGSLSKEELDRCVNKSMNSIDHMSKTIDDFRNFFKPDKERVLFKIKEVVAKTVSLVEDSFKSQQIKIDLSVSDNPALTGFPNEYSQVLLNILSNARDALQERRPNGAIVTISVGREEERAVVTIADNAGGIPEEIMERIFEPYFTTKGPDKGTGVGLFMSKTIIERNMNGRLTARNTVEGAEFRIEV